MARELKIAIAQGPKCPCCGETGFDDWWHDPTLKTGFGIVAITGRLKCHGCGTFFSVEHYHDGETHSFVNSRKAA